MLKKNKIEEEIEETEEVEEESKEKEELLALYAKLKELGITRISDLEGMIARS
jgi:hypothetical protein